ncbi:MAG TPA: quinone-dependent dihydroorotate dehydrogenase [Pyrinomonadaceae bacterium]|nr:quinone-dependent dihydroorotate dehydrogenase [Pyrinomonadaceae bacterium]
MIYRSLLRPILFRLPAETAHELALKSLSLSQEFSERIFADRYRRSPFGKLRRFGLTFENPVGLAAGFDKDGIALRSLAALGFGFIEAGTVTFHAQAGNKRPRLFRLPLDHALINRAGFNNKGAADFVKRVQGNRPASVLGVSIGKSRIVELDNAVADYLKTFSLVFPVADYIAVNVSSPNTPGLRELQQAEQLEKLLTVLQKRNEELASRAGRSTLLPLLVKLSPDLNDDELRRALEVACRRNVAGLIATNTTTGRAGLRTNGANLKAFGDGGLSGQPLRARALNVIAKLYQMTSGSLPIIGVGGIFDADDAWQMISAGACLVQVYTGFIYRGPSIARDINDGLRRIISREGFVSFDEAVGCRAEHYAKADPNEHIAE